MLMLILALPRVLVRFVELQSVGLLVLGPSWALTSLSGTVDDVLVTFELGLVLQRHVALDHFLVKAYLQKLIGAELRLGSPSLL